MHANLAESRTKRFGLHFRMRTTNLGLSGAAWQAQVANLDAFVRVSAGLTSRG
jgi:hypothetical protein